MYAYRIMLDELPIVDCEAESNFIYLTEEEATNKADEIISLLSSQYGRHYLDFDIIIYSTD